MSTTWIEYAVEDRRQRSGAKSVSSGGCGLGVGSTLYIHTYVHYLNDL